MGFVGRKVVEMVTKEKVTYQDNTDRKATAELLKAVKALKLKHHLAAGSIISSSGERCRELIDAADEMTRHLYCVVDWLALHPEYNLKTKVMPKKDYPVLVDATF